MVCARVWVRVCAIGQLKPRSRQRQARSIIAANDNADVDVDDDAYNRYEICMRIDNGYAAAEEE